jgi:hypothetical protein
MVKLKHASNHLEGAFDREIGSKNVQPGEQSLAGPGFDYLNTNGF